MKKRISYVADDGSVFFTDEDCLKHEKERKEAEELFDKVKSQRERDKKRIRAMKVDIDVQPIFGSGYINYEDCYLNWYLLKNKEDYNFLKEHVEYLDLIKEFPAYVCCYSVNDLEEDLYCENSATFEENVEVAKYFFDAFGYEMELKKKEGK